MPNYIASIQKDRNQQVMYNGKFYSPSSDTVSPRPPRRVKSKRSLMNKAIINCYMKPTEDRIVNKCYTWILN